jgi:Matrixin
LNNNNKLFLILYILSALIVVVVVILSTISPFTIALAGDDEEDFEENNSIRICCTWGEKLDDGILTYSIQRNIDAEKKEAVRDAIRDWDDKIELIEFNEIPSMQEEEEENKPDIQVKFINNGDEFAKEGPETAGNTKTRLDQSGFIKYNLIIIAEGGLGKTFDIKTIKTIAKHEIGHALGLGHANFKSNLMTNKIESAAENISSCELEAIRQANSWKLVDQSKDSHPRFPSTTTIICKG